MSDTRICGHCGRSYERVYGNQGNRPGGQGGTKYCSRDCAVDARRIISRNYKRAERADPVQHAVLVNRTKRWILQNPQLHSLRSRLYRYRKRLETLP